MSIPKYIHAFCYIFLLFVLLPFVHCGPSERRTDPDIPTPEDLQQGTDNPRSVSDNPENWNVRVTMESAVIERHRLQEAGVNWRVSGGSVSAGGSPLTQNDLRVGVARLDVDVSVLFKQSNRTTRSSSRQVITTLNKHPAELRLQEVSRQLLPGSILIYGPQGTEVLTRYSEQITGVNLRVLPEIIERGPELRLQIIPSLARPGGQSITLHELETTVRVQSGQSVLLAATNQKTRTIGSTLFSARDIRSSEEVAWVVTPRILK